MKKVGRVESAKQDLDNRCGLLMAPYSIKATTIPS